MAAYHVSDLIPRDVSMHVVQIGRDVQGPVGEYNAYTVEEACRGDLV